MHAYFKYSLTGHSSGVYCLHEAQETGKFFSGSADGVVALWDPVSKVSAPFSIKVGHPVLAIESDFERGLLLLGQSEGHIHVIELEKRKELRNLHYCTKGIFKIKLLRKQGLILALGGDGNLAVIGADDFSLKLLCPLSANKLRCLLLSHDDQILFIGGSDGYIRVLDTSYFNEWEKVDAHEGGVYCLGWISDSLMVSGGRDGHLRFWEVKDRNMQLQESIPAHNYAIYDLAIAKEGRFFASGSRDKSLKIWDLENLRTPQKLLRKGLQGHSHSVNCLLLKNDESILLSGGDDKQIIAWELNSGA